MTQILQEFVPFEWFNRRRGPCYHILYFVLQLSLGWRFLLGFRPSTEAPTGRYFLVTVIVSILLYPPSSRGPLLPDHRHVLIRLVGPARSEDWSRPLFLPPLFLWGIPCLLVQIVPLLPAGKHPKDSVHLNIDGYLSYKRVLQRYELKSNIHVQKPLFFLKSKKSNMTSEY